MSVQTFNNECIFLINRDLLELSEELHFLAFSNEEIFVHTLLKNNMTLQNMQPEVWEYLDSKNEEKLDIQFQYSQLLELRNSFVNNDISQADWDFYFEAVVGML